MTVSFLSFGIVQGGHTWIVLIQGKRTLGALLFPALSLAGSSVRKADKEKTVQDDALVCGFDVEGAHEVAILKRPLFPRVRHKAESDSE